MVEKTLLPELHPVKNNHLMLEKTLIFWDEVREVYSHHNRMHYRPQRNKSVTYSTSDRTNFRALYYVPSSGVLNLAIHGQLGASNKLLLRYQDWDNNTFYSEKILDFISEKGHSKCLIT